MRYWRLIVLALLLAGPTVFLIGCGAYYLWESGLWHVVWWPLAACLAVGYILGWHWQRRQQLLRVDFTPPVHWTERDQQAWKLVQARAAAAAKSDIQKLSDVPHYLATAQEMALELARFYHPKAQDPVGALTIPEILAVVELASHDLAELIDQYLPGGHLLTVNAWRRARQAADIYQTASNVSWLVSSLFAPVNTSIRYLATHVGVTTPWQKLQHNLLLWFYTAYVHRLGTYLIDLNSGRLRVGARRYRELLQQSQNAAPDGATEPADETRPVTLTVLGQAKAGKSSVINALLGEQRAHTGVLPLTSEVTRYHLQPEGIPLGLDILDTAGYGPAELTDAQRRAIQDAARESDLLLLVLHARNPARQADVEQLNQLRKFFDSHPDLKMPPVVGVLTHIDLLSPALEWDPPYDWQNPRRPKEEQIDQAVAAVREALGPFLAAVVPVCTAPERIYGVQEWLLPAVAKLLDQARGVSLLRCLRAEADAGKVRKVLEQLLAAGKETVKIWLNKK
jgi:predicted GTPase